MYYTKDGRPTSEPRSIEVSCRPLRDFYGQTPARDFGPLKLKALRQAAHFRGLLPQGHQPADRAHRPGLPLGGGRGTGPAGRLPGPGGRHEPAEGRSQARETTPVGPVADGPIDAVKPYVSRQVWEMIGLQRLTGMRPGEVVIMRAGDIDRTGAVWTYIPGRHKTEHHGKKRTIFLGPKAQDVVRPWLRADPDAYLFSPSEAEAERRVEQRRRRLSRVQPSQVDRTVANPKRAAGRRYTVTSYRQAIARGCLKAGVPPWFPNQIRHTVATRLRKEFGLDAARVILGHSSPTVTEVYAERDTSKAADVMGKVG